MKLFRFGYPGEERPGIMDVEGKHRSLVGIIEDIDGRVFRPSVQRQLEALDLSALPILGDGERIAPCIANVGQIFGVGLNYGDHAAEMQLERSAEPVIFVKSAAAMCGCNDPLTIPYPAAQVDWEVELAVIIGTEARSIPVGQAMSHVGGYCVANDVTDRRMQFVGAAPQWSLSKSFDGFAPLGPYLVTADEVSDYRDLHLWTDVNGQRVQDDHARTMLMPVAEIIAYLASYLTLRPGDVILTGSPAGAGKAQIPPRYMEAGDLVTTGIDGLGVQHRKVESYCAQNLHNDSSSYGLKV